MPFVVVSVGVAGGQISCPLAGLLVWALQSHAG